MSTRAAYGAARSAVCGKSFEKRSEGLASRKALNAVGSGAPVPLGACVPR
jgi:hypothetical protein